MTGVSRILDRTIGRVRDRQRAPGPVPPERLLPAIRELSIPAMRELAGRHEYDGVVQDLSESGVTAGLLALGRAGLPRRAPHRPTARDLRVAAGLSAPPPVRAAVDVPGHRSHQSDRSDRSDQSEAAQEAALDELYLRITAAGLRWYLGDFEAHRRDPQLHLANLDLGCYERGYGPQAERAAARARHLALWPDAIDIAITTLDAVPAPVAAARLESARSLAEPLIAPPQGRPIASAAVIERARTAHARLIADLEQRARHGDPKIAVGPHHLRQFLGGFDGLEIALDGLADRADAERNRVGGALTRACAAIDPHRPTRDVVASQNLTPAGAAQNPPAQDLAAQNLAAQDRCGTGAPAGAGLVAQTAAMLSRGATSPVRQQVLSRSFIEGWAHYTQEDLLRLSGSDPEFEIGVHQDSLRQTTRLVCAIALHTGVLDVAGAAQRFELDAHLSPAEARLEAELTAADPGHGRAALGKLEMRRLRSDRESAWGTEFSPLRFHRALQELGAPPLALIRTVL